MVLVGLLLALSLVTLVAVLVSCELQARATRETGTVVTLPGAGVDEFDRIVASLVADPDFGRFDRRSSP